MVTDLRNAKNVQNADNATILKHGRIFLVVNCAGMGSETGVTSPDLLDNLNILLHSSKPHISYCCHYASDALIETKGCVIDICSICGTTVIKRGISYSITKAAMIHFTKYAALKLGEKGVRIYSISPEPVDTNIRMEELKSQEVSDQYWNSFAEQTPLKQLVQAEKITEMAGFLVSDQARSITGVDYIVDSGMTLKKFKPK